MKSITRWRLVVAIFVLTACVHMNNREKRILAIDCVHGDYVSNTSHHDNPQLAIATADHMLEIMDKDIIDWRPYAMKGDAYVWTSQIELAQECFAKALEAISNPKRTKSMIDAPQIVEGDKRLLEKRVMFLKEGKRWKSDGEFLDLLRSDIEDHKKGRTGQ